jgi:hypothetical protein
VGSHIEISNRVRLMESIEKNLREGSPKELAQNAQAIACCERCPLYIDATQAVIGEGPAPAAIMLVGEQPATRKIVPAVLLSGPRAASWIAPRGKAVLTGATSS